MDWLIPVVAAVGAILTLILSDPKNKRLAFLTAVFILIPAAWQSYRAYQYRRAEMEIVSHAQGVLSRHTRQYLTFIRDMVFYSSDGWLPSNEAEFFSRRTADLICGSLNINANAPVLPDRPWREWIAQNAQAYRTQLNGIFQNRAQLLEPDLIKAVATAIDSHLLGTLSSHLVLQPTIDRKLGVRRTPVFCMGVEPLIEKDLQDIHALYKLIRREEESNDRIGDWKFLNMRDDKRWPRHLLGSNRIEKG